MLARLASGDDAYLTATIQETLRRRPVLPNAAPRLVKRPVEIGGWTYPPGVCSSPTPSSSTTTPRSTPSRTPSGPSGSSIQAGTYTWIPFGGGRRRCLGASFALLEMRVVLRAAAERFSVAPAGPARGVKRRMITLTPGDGATVVLAHRVRAPEVRPPAATAAA